MFTAVWGAVMISFVVLMVSNAFNMTEVQEKTLKKIDQSRSAARAISKAFKYFLIKKKLHLEKRKNDPLF